MKKQLHLVLYVIIAFGQSVCAQTVQEADIWPGAQSSIPGHKTVFDGKLYFQANDGINGYELWSYDGMTAALVANVNAGGESSDSYPQCLTVFDSKLYFRAVGDGGGMELYSFDGVQVELAADIYSGSGSSVPADLTIYDGKLYFSANDGVHGYELWSFDGTSAQLEADIRPGPLGGPSNDGPKFLITYDDKLFFTAYDGNRTNVWSFDGDTAVVEVDFESQPSTPGSLIVYDGKLYFWTKDWIPGTELKLWSFDGNNAVVEASSFYDEGGGSSPTINMTEYNGELFFDAPTGTGQSKLWSFDGDTATIKSQVTAIQASVSDYNYVFHDKLFFLGYTESNGMELWSFDGDTTILETDIRSGSGNGGGTDLMEYNDKLYFTANDGISGHELWSIDSSSVGVGISDRSQISKPKVFPNPTGGHLFVNLGKEREAQVNIYNSVGSLIYSTKHRNGNMLEAQLTGGSGIYLIQVTYHDKTTINLKVVKK